MRLLGRHSECAFLEAVRADALDGRSRAVVLRGEPGVGKTALLDFLVDGSRGWQIARAVAVESEMELVYGGLHQLCAPLLEHLEQLPAPQRDALSTVFGLHAGEPPDRFLVGLATLTLLATVADQQPLLCVVDDAHWLDAASAQILLFVARRLLAEPIALVCAARSGLGDGVLAGLPALPLKGLGESDARTLLLENLPGPVDAAVCTQIIMESHGNPLALLELPRTWNSAELAGGFGIPAREPVGSRIEQSFATRLRRLPAATQLFVLAAAAEPLGDPILLHGAAEILGLDPAASGPALDAGLLHMSSRVEFAHPLVRSAAYSSAGAEDRQRVHRALADATDPERDPDRRVWHRARAAPGPDENVAAELERSAGRAQARGGLAAGAAFLERASALSPDSLKRAQRALRAAEAMQLAGLPQAASSLLAIATDGPLDEIEGALAERLRGRIALDLRRGGDATPLLLEAAARLEASDPAVARKTYLAALFAACFVSEETLRSAATAARSAPAAETPPSADDLMLDALAVRFTDGYSAGATLTKQALQAYRDEDSSTVEDVRWPGIARRIAPDMFEDEIWHDIVTRSAQLARERGALGVLPLALNNLAFMLTFEGKLEAAKPLLEEADAIAEATDGDRITFGRLIHAAFRGDESAVSEHVEIDKAKALARGEGLLPTVGQHANALLYNGLGRYDTAMAAAAAASEVDAPITRGWSLAELVEAANHCGEHDLAQAAVERLAERTQAAGTDWALGIEARSRAQLSAGSPTDDLYQEAIERLGRCRIAPERARAHLLYGEWLRREGRRVDARGQLRTAHEMLSGFGMDGFAERARRELIATGEHPRKRSAETRSDLTAQEAQIAQLAREGYSNPEIGAQLFLSPRTVEWHMRKVFAKLAITSRRQLDVALGESPKAPQLT